MKSQTHHKINFLTPPNAVLNPGDGLVVTAGGGGGWAAMPKGSLPGTGGRGLSCTDASLFIETYCLGSFLTGGGGVGVAGRALVHSSWLYQGGQQRHQPWVEDQEVEQG